MNDKVGKISFPVKKSSEFGKKPYSDKLTRLIDEVKVTAVLDMISKDNQFLFNFTNFTYLQYIYSGNRKCITIIEKN